MPAAPRLLPFPSAPPCPRGRGGARGHAPSFAAPSPLRAPYSHGKGGHVTPAPPPSAAAPSTRGKGHARARDPRPVTLLLWLRRPVHAEREHARARRPLPSPFARKGGAQGHAAPLRPRSLPHDRAVLYARKGARVGAPPSALSFPIRTEGGRTRARGPATPLGRLPVRAKRAHPARLRAKGARERSAPLHPFARTGDHAGTPLLAACPPFSRKGGTGASLPTPVPVRRSDARGSTRTRGRGARVMARAHPVC
ncbi:hypothetical protein EDB85DRAFT_2230033 [Lactarius pseudohatsudake]|nr:hypothetical protein EDB85DRAFT_2230033 [Lactarius pseudohatsudake]